ncbi:MAG: hypothetical protein V3V61_03905, partial [Gammaproteobacteria bacterium]
MNFAEFLLKFRVLFPEFSSTLVGGTLPSLATITAISDGSLIMNGQPVTAIDFSSDVSYADIALTLQSALVAANVNVTVTADLLNTSLIVKTIAEGAVLTYASTEGSGTDISDLFALSSTTSVSLKQGVTDELLAIYYDQGNAIFGACGLALQYLVAHLIAIDTANGVGEAGGATGATLDGGNGENTTETVGQVTVNLMTMAESGKETYFTSTS